MKDSSVSVGGDFRYRMRYDRIRCVFILCFALAVFLGIISWYIYIYIYQGGPQNYKDRKIGVGMLILSPATILLLVAYMPMLFRSAVKVSGGGIHFNGSDSRILLQGLGRVFIDWYNVAELVIYEPVPGVAHYSRRMQDLDCFIGVVVKDLGKVQGLKFWVDRAGKTFNDIGYHFVCPINMINLDDVHQGVQVLRRIAGNIAYDFTVSDTRNQPQTYKISGAFTPNCYIELPDGTIEDILIRGKLVCNNRNRKIAMWLIPFFSLLAATGALWQYDYWWNGIPVCSILSILSGLLMFVTLVLILCIFRQADKAAIKYGYLLI